MILFFLDSNSGITRGVVDLAGHNNAGVTLGFDLDESSTASSANPKICSSPILPMTRTVLNTRAICSALFTIVSHCVLGFNAGSKILSVKGCELSAVSWII